MKKYTFILFLVVMTLSLSAQTLNDEQRLSILPYVPQRTSLSEPARSLLESKIQQVISNNGISDKGFQQRFVMTAKVNATSKDIIAGPPSMVSLKYDVMFMIGDVIENKIYSTITIPIVGVGQTDAKAMLNALKAIKSNDTRLKQLIEKSKETIISYYRANSQRIISDAYTKVEQNMYNEALYMLASVPDVCLDCYFLCQDAIVDIYRRLINDNGQKLFNKAKEEWVKSPNYVGAEIAINYIEQIDINAECQNDVQSLLVEIGEKIKVDEKRDWDFKMQKYRDEQKRKQQEWDFKVQQYEDALEKEQRDFEFEKQKYQDGVRRENQELDFARHKFDTNAAIEKQTISAARDVAIEYAKNQPETINYNNIIYW